MFTLRPYQQESIDALHKHVCEKQTNPCIVLPTGSGKSIVMAAAIQKWKQDAPWIRGCILAHRKELVSQNADKLKSYSSQSGKEIGIFSAGLGRKDFDSPILFASIDSIFKRHGELQPFDFIFVDEAHRIPPSGEGKYRTFINGCRRFSPKLKVVGWTATPFRMACGPICHKDHILNEICYEAGITELIDQGFLSRLRSKVSASQPELTDVRRNAGGDYIVSSLSDATNKQHIIEAAVSESVSIIKHEHRQHIVFFCVDIEHCKRVSQALQRLGVCAPCITGKTKSDERDRILADFQIGKLRAICNVNVLTEGFDAPHIDCIALLRPTLSAGLFSQMVGRGLRIHPSKNDCLVLDFANCIDEHGPLDLLGTGQRVVTATCENCRESFSRATRTCPICGWEIPKQEIERLEQTERERRMHGDKVSKKSILSNEPETLKVDTVYVARHVKEGAPDSLRVQYRCGMGMYREWVCLDHKGYPGQKAHAWWRERFGPGKPGKPSPTVGSALGDLFITQALLEWTKTITILKKGRYFEIIGYNGSV